MRINSLVLVIIITCFITSCNYQKKLQEQLYFNDALDSSHRVLANYIATVNVDDRLAIGISALSVEAAAPYNMSTASAGGSLGYLVEKDGTILFPQIGKLKVEGKTLPEIRTDLVAILSKYLTDPVVTVQFANARILVMGEVGKPGVLPIPDGKLTILEAITLSGDIPVTGRKDNVLVVREENGQRSFANVNLQSHNIYKSPYFFLRQNDLVYVEPTLLKVKQQSNQLLLGNISFVTTIMGALSTTIFLLTYLKLLK